jgi:hypothetical protein
MRIQIIIEHATCRNNQQCQAYQGGKPLWCLHLVWATHAAAHSFQDPPLVLPIQERGQLVQQQHLHGSHRAPIYLAAIIAVVYAP